MKVAYISHSLVAQRQALFAQALRDTGLDVNEVYPTQWGRHYRPGGCEVSNHGDMIHYRLAPPTWIKLQEWQPDVVLLQQEAYCDISSDAIAFCHQTDTPLVTFSWENRIPVDDQAVYVLDDAIFNIFGNSDARNLAQRAHVETPHAILPQVGIDRTIFAPLDGRPKYDIIFTGRANDPMKGESVLDEATYVTAWRVAKRHQHGHADYADLRAWYSSGIIQCTPSRDVPGHPREQFAPAVTIEGLMCGTPVVTTTQSAIHEWLHDCPAAWCAPPNDPWSLRALLNEALRHHDIAPTAWRTKQQEARAWATERFSNEVVARDYAAVLAHVVYGAPLPKLQAAPTPSTQRG